MLKPDGYPTIQDSILVLQSFKEEYSVYYYLPKDKVQGVVSKAIKRDAKQMFSILPFEVLL